MLYRLEETNVARIEHIGWQLKEVLVSQSVFRKGQRSECPCDQFVLVCRLPQRIPEIVKRKTGSVTSHYLEPPEKFSATVAAEASSECQVADVCEGDVGSSRVKVDTVLKHHGLEPKIDKIREEKVLLVKRK